MALSSCSRKIRDWEESHREHVQENLPRFSGPHNLAIFTLSAIYHATSELLHGIDLEDPQEAAELALNFWEEIAKHMAEWERVRAGRVTAGEIRADYIHTHGVVLQALARAGNALIRRHPEGWSNEIAKVGGIDWRRANVALWEGRALLAGRVSKAQQNVSLTTNAIKTHLGLPLSPEEQRVEDAFRRENADAE